MQVEISYNFNSKEKYKYVDEMLKKLTKEDLLQFYLDKIQPLLGRMDGENFYDLNRVIISSYISFDKTNYYINFEDTGRYSNGIMFTLFKYVGDYHYGDTVDRLTRAWQDFLALKLGDEYKELIVKYYKNNYIKEEKRIDEEMDKLREKQNESWNNYKKIVERIGYNQTVDAADDIK